ncbi:CU044_5270 family protein [Streptomyces xiamenensis]|uniref:CU044_5270 family protein n=1 Tax=Streptomyces xiamenensis TaxID=408015 RepID=UPI0036E6BBEE
MHDADEALRALNPRPAGKSTTSDVEEQELLQRILVTAQEPRRRPRRRPLVAAMALSIATAVTVAVGIGLFDSPAQQPAYAATPPPLAITESDGRSAEQVLEDIASRVEAIPEEDSAGERHYFAQEMWSLTTRFDGQQVTSAVVPEHREAWKETDGSFTWSTTAGQPEFQNDRQREVWEEQWAQVGEPAERSGTGASPYGDPPFHPLEMEDWLFDGAPADPAGMISESLVARTMTTYFSPEQRAAVLRVLASIDDLEYEGMTTDRAGRTGLAVSIESSASGLPSRHTLVIDQETGKILGYEQELTTDAGELNVEVPAVINYVTFLE